MARNWIKGLALAIMALSTAACEDGKIALDTEAPATTGEDGAAAVATVPGEARDVEAPEVFSLSDQGLWDGRPSLGGVWVAHVSVGQPERVIIRNAANDKSVIGALFRRERDNPGPSLQVSSDAADALGMLAGQPAELEVVALRREEAVVAAAPEADAEADTEADAPDADAAGAIEQTTLEPVAAAAAAAIDEAEALAAPEALPEAADETETEPAPVEVEPAAAEPAPAPAPAAPAPAGDALRRAYVQIGIFSVEDNAKRAVEQMQKAGMTATAKADQSQGKTFWRVIVGPAATEADRDALAAKVKALGYPDAYPVSQ